MVAGSIQIDFVSWQLSSGSHAKRRSVNPFGKLERENSFAGFWLLSYTNRKSPSQNKKCLLKEQDCARASRDTFRTNAQGACACHGSQPPELRSDSVFFSSRVSTQVSQSLKKYQNRDLTNYLELQAAPAPPLWLSSVGGSIRGAHNFL